MLVIATAGEQGEVARDCWPTGETLADAAWPEMQRSAEVLGVERVELLGYERLRDDGRAQNDEPECFWQADVDEAAERLAAILREESTSTC